MRPDGTRVKDESAIVQAIPYIMPHRYDAQNFFSDYADMEVLRSYVHRKRREGVRISYMSLVLAAYYKAYLENPKVNRFIMNRKIYQRNHFCVSFVILKTRADGTPDETTCKVFFTPEDDVVSINRKIEEIIEKNHESTHDNATDKFANFMFSVPLLPGLVIGLASFLDKHGWLPRAIIDLSPFHTSLFITNLASINMGDIYHHCYEFGTTGVFISMGRPIANYVSGEYRKKLMPLSVVMDERICTGVEYSRFCKSFQHYLAHPEETENPSALPEKGAAPEAEKTDETKEEAAV